MLSNMAATHKRYGGIYGRTPLSVLFTDENCGKLTEKQDAEQKKQLTICMALTDTA